MTRITRTHQQLALFALRLIIALILGYFGIAALTNPSSQLGWLAGWVRALPLIGTETFIQIFGFLEVLVALLMLTGYKLREASFGAAILLLLITTNLFWIDFELAFRDLVIFIASIVVATTPEYRWTLRKRAVL